MKNHDRPLQAGCLSSPPQISWHEHVRIVLSGEAAFNIIIWADLEALTAAQQHGNQILFVCLTDSRWFIRCYFRWISGLPSIRFPLAVPFSISSFSVLSTNQFEDELWGKSWQCSLFLLLLTRPFCAQSSCGGNVFLSHLRIQYALHATFVFL